MADDTSEKKILPPLDACWSRPVPRHRRLRAGSPQDGHAIRTTLVRTTVAALRGPERNSQQRGAPLPPKLHSVSPTR